MLMIVRAIFVWVLLSGVAAAQCYSGCDYLTATAAAQTYQPIGTTPTYVSGFTRASPGLTASLLAAAPCSASYVGQLAIVSDLWSGGASTNEVLRCGSSGSAYYWRPQRTDYAATISTTGGSMTASCLVTPPTIFVSGTLTTSLTITLSTANCWPGATFSIANNAVLGALGFNVSGLAGNVSKALALNARLTAVYDGTSWNVY